MRNDPVITAPPVTTSIYDRIVASTLVAERQAFRVSGSGRRLKSTLLCIVKCFVRQAGTPILLTVCA